MSDIDLATLHKTRLEERVNYKFSWLSRRLISDKQKQIKNSRNVILSNNAIGDSGINYANSNCNLTSDLNSSDSALRNDAIDARLIENCTNDDDYFVTQRRRRSGTWP